MFVVCLQSHMLWQFAVQKKPGKLVFDQNLMRCHLLECLEKKKEDRSEKRTSKFRKGNT